jgi:hypothetical protein
MSQLTLNSIPSLDAILREARTKDRHVKHHALDTQHNFHLRHVHSWYNMDQTVFMQMCLPPMQPRYTFDGHTWLYQTSKSTMFGLQPTLHREQRYFLIKHVQRLKTLYVNNQVVLHLPSVRSPRLPRFTPEPRYKTRRQSTRALMTWPASSLRPILVPTVKLGLRGNPRPFLPVVFSIKLSWRNGWRYRGKTWMRSASPRPPSPASVSCQLNEWTND